jgi:hypothetical protein
MTCPTCDKDITSLSAARKQIHVNRCLNKEKDRQQPKERKQGKDALSLAELVRKLVFLSFQIAKFSRASLKLLM